MHNLFIARYDRSIQSPRVLIRSQKKCKILDLEAPHAGAIREAVGEEVITSINDDNHAE